MNEICSHGAFILIHLNRVISKNLSDNDNCHTNNNNEVENDYFRLRSQGRAS